MESHDYDVLVMGSGGSGLRAAIAAAEAGARTGLVCKSLLGKAHTVMAEGGARRVARQRRARGQLEHPLPGHDVRRQVPEQLAHGRTARQGGARPRSRARALGRRLRPYPGPPHVTARVRRPHLPAAGPHRRPHRARDDPHAPGQDRPQRRRRLHGDDDHAPDQGRGAGGGLLSATACPTGEQITFAPGAGRSRPAAVAGSTGSRRTRRTAPATATRWRTRPAPS